ncbi:MAG TPA: Nramp family divalent metal transporter [Candidatus Saccharimonadales bacterium]
MKGLSRRTLTLLGPAFVAAVAYVDPGNFAANFSAGAQYGYLLLWVLIVANLMAVLVQYLSAKVGLVTGKSLPEVIGERLPRSARIAYWLQAEAVAIACDIAEVVGGALALNILFGVPLVLGGVIVGIVSMILLVVYEHPEKKYFERMIILMLTIIPLGFIVGLINFPPDIMGMLGGTVPRFQGTETVVLAAAMLGATIMPHVVYLHSALARDRHGKVSKLELKRYLRATKFDVGIAMVVAGSVNISMLLLAASALQGNEAVESFQGIFGALQTDTNGLIALLFAVGLLVSGLTSTSVASQAGSVIMHGLLKRKVNVYVRRMVTIIPAFIILVVGFDPSTALIISQVVLSFGVPFALIPLTMVTSSRKIMGDQINPKAITYIVWGIAGVVSLLNIALIWLTVVG